MNKYNNLKFLKKTKAMKPHICNNCGQNIEKRGIYYKESVGKVNAPSLKLRGFCVECYQERGDRLLVIGSF